MLRLTEIIPANYPQQRDSWPFTNGPDGANMGTGELPHLFSKGLLAQPDGSHERMMQMNEQTKFYTVQEFLECYPMGRSTLYRLVNCGDIPIVKFGRSSRIAKADAEAWAARLPRFTGNPANDNV